MRGNSVLIAIVITAAVWATIAHGGDFNACREGIDQYQPSFTPVEVTFRPYFSSKTPWTGTVEVVGEEGPGGVRTINIINGGFTDQFVQEEVHIYKFARPAPYVAE